MPKLIIEKNAFDPIEVEYNGKTYVVNPITTELLIKSNELELKGFDGDLEANDENLLLFIDIPKPELSKMTFQEKQAILLYIRESIQNPEQYQSLIKKKTIKSGDTKPSK